MALHYECHLKPSTDPSVPNNVINLRVQNCYSSKGSGAGTQVRHGRHVESLQTECYRPMCNGISPPTLIRAIGCSLELLEMVILEVQLGGRYVPLGIIPSLWWDEL